MTKVRGWILIVGAMMFALVLLLPFFAIAQDAAPASPEAPRNLALEHPSVSSAPAPVDVNTKMMVGLAALLAVSEALSLIPQVKANGLVQLFILMARRVLGRPAGPVVLLVAVGLSVSGCGKSLEQIKQAAHAVIDIAGKVYEDVKEDVDQVKDALNGQPSGPPASERLLPERR